MRLTLDEVIAEYLAYRRLQYAPNTVRNDDKALRSLMAAIGNIQIRSVTPGHIDTFFASLKLAPGSINNYNASLRSFFKWTRERKITPAGFDPMVGRRFLKEPPKRKVHIPADQFDRVLDAATHPTDRMLVALGLYLFLRQGEIQTLRLKDVDLARGEVHVNVWKTAQRDVMPICEELDIELRRWLTFYSANADHHLEHFLVPAKTAAHFTGVAGGPFTLAQEPKLIPDRPVRRVYHAVKRVLTHSDFYVVGECGHMLRRSGARALYDRLSADGHDRAARRAQAMLHHATLAQTERYLGVDIDVKERNDILRGKPMFPKAENVVNLKMIRGAAVGDEEGSRV